MMARSTFGDGIVRLCNNFRICMVPSIKFYDAFVATEWNEETMLAGVLKMSMNSGWNLSDKKQSGQFF